MNNTKTFRNKKTPNNNLITQSNYQLVYELKKYSQIREIGFFVKYFNLLTKYNKLKDYTFKTSINTEQKQIEVLAYKKGKKHAEFRDVCSLSTTNYMLQYNTTFFANKNTEYDKDVYRNVVLNPTNNGLISLYQNGVIENGKQIAHVGIWRDKTAQQTNSNCVYVIKDINKDKKFYHIEKDISNYLLNQNKPPFPTSKDFDLVDPSNFSANSPKTPSNIQFAKPEGRGMEDFIKATSRK